MSTELTDNTPRFTRHASLHEHGSRSTLPSPSSNKRAGTISGSTPVTRLNMEMKSEPGSQSNLKSSTDDIVHMRQEIMMSLQRSPSKLYGEDHDRSSPTRRPTSARRATVQEVKEDTKSLKTRNNYNRKIPLHPKGGSHNDDIYTEDVRGQSRSPVNEYESFDMTEEHTNTNNTSATHTKPKSRIASETRSRMSNALGKPSSYPDLSEPQAQTLASKRVLSRQNSPEKPVIASTTKIQPGLHPRKRSKNSPPQSITNRSVSASTISQTLQEKPRSLVRPTLLSSDMAKMNITKKSLSHGAGNSNGLNGTSVFSTSNIIKEPSIPRYSQVISKAAEETKPNHPVTKQASTGSLRPPSAVTNARSKLEPTVKRTVDKFNGLNNTHSSSASLLNDTQQPSFTRTHSMSKSEKDQTSIKRPPSSHRTTRNEENKSSNLVSPESETDLAKTVAAHATEIASLKAKLAGKETELQSMRESMIQSEERAVSSGQRLQESLEELAQELHAQYTKKHEIKMEALSKQHMEESALRFREYEDRIRELERAIESERIEKDELVKTCDMYLEMEAIRAQEEE